MTGDELRGDADDESFAGPDADVEGHGEAVARALLAGEPGDADGRTGWRGRLQAAADDSDDDPGILRIGDAIHAAAPGLRDREALRALLAALPADAGTPPARAFLAGAADVLDPDPYLDGVH